MFQGPGAFISGSDSCFMVVFQYGSIMFFSVREHEVDEYLKIVEKHASGLLSEMRKDGEFIFSYLIYQITILLSFSRVAVNRDRPFRNCNVGTWELT